MAWYRFTLDEHNSSFLAQVSAVPGMNVRGLEVTCHDNAAWLVERIARNTGARYTVVETKGDREELEALDKLVEGGLRDWVPGYLTEYQREGVMAMAHRDGHLWWAAGCLAGDTVVDARWACAEHRLKLRELVGRFNGEVGGWRGPIEVLSYNEATGGMVWNKLEAAVVSGVKQLFRLRTMRGYIDATADHRFLTPNGWKRLGELVAGLDTVFFRNGFSDGAHLVGVQKIQPLGRAPTFDLCMAAPHHNFIANGIVVHNSGKTLGAICWALASPGRTVLATRAGIRRQHAREIERVTTHRALVMEESKDADKLAESDALFAVVGYEMLPDIVDRLLLWKPTNLILDESHSCKSNKRWSASSQADGKVKFEMLENIATAVYRLSRAARRRLATTATPIKDRVRDLWAQLDLVHPDAWGRFYAKDKASFTGRYCAAREGMYGGIDTSGSSNLDELWNRVSLVTHHVPHSVTHRHLPPRRRVVTYVTPAEQCRAEGFTQKFFKQAAKGGGQTGLLEARLMEAAAKKRKVLREMVAEAVACGQKVTIFTGRREDCDRLGEEIKKDHPTVSSWCAHGGTSAKDRDGIQQDYMRHPGPCVLVGTGDAWGTGVSLHDTDLALIAMLPYTPGAVVQWEGRFSRQGQKRPVLIQYLVAEGTVDEHVVELLLAKLRPVEKVSHDDSIEGFSDSLRGLDDEEAILGSILDKLGVTSDAKGDK